MLECQVVTTYGLAGVAQVLAQPLLDGEREAVILAATTGTSTEGRTFSVPAAAVMTVPPVARRITKTIAAKV